MGFTIGAKSCGYGLSLPHYGTIVVGDSNSIGNYAKLHVSTCIASKGSHIGDNFYIGTGAIISKKITLGDNVTIASNSLVRSSFGSNLLLAGNPAVIKKTKKPWFTNIQNRVDKIEQLRKEYL